MGKNPVRSYTLSIIYLLLYLLAGMFLYNYLNLSIFKEIFWCFYAIGLIFFLCYYLASKLDLDGPPP